MQIGVVIVGHGHLPEELIRITEGILQLRLSSFEPVCIFPMQDPAVSLRAVEQAIARVDQNEGVLLLTDLFGATPSNLCLPFLMDGKIEMISGVNLPMVIKLASVAEKRPLHALVALLQEYGKKHIFQVEKRE